MTAPIDNLQSAMLARASDLAHYLHEKCGQVEVVSGYTLSGLPCAMILAVGPAAASVADFGAKMKADAEQQSADRSDSARRN